MSKFDHFDWLSPYYDRLFKSEISAYLLKCIDLPIHGAILDVGGGTGRISQKFVGLAGSVVVADSSFGMLKQAARKKSLQTICAQSEKLPFQSMWFERVIIVDAFHHVLDQRETLQELWRVLKPGGKLIIEEPDVRTIAVKIVAVVEKLLMMRSHFINPLRIAKILHLHNARIIITQEGTQSWVIFDKV